MKGKAKCKALKEIRRQIAESNDIPYAVSQCTYQGDCKGTCPKCEAELKYLERELAIRQSLGKAVAVTGISVSVCASLTACTPDDLLKYIPGYEAETAGVAPMPLTGDAPIPVTPATTPSDDQLTGEAPIPEESEDGQEGTDDDLPEIEGDIEIIEEDLPLGPESDYDDYTTGEIDIEDVEGDIYIEDDDQGIKAP